MSCQTLVYWLNHGLWFFVLHEHSTTTMCVCAYVSGRVYWETARTRGHFTYTPSVLADLMLRRFDKSHKCVDSFAYLHFECIYLHSECIYKTNRGIHFIYYIESLMMTFASLDLPREFDSRMSLVT